MSGTEIDRIALAVSRATGARFRPVSVEPVGGGCINSAMRLTDGRRSYFVKTNAASSIDMFEAERDGLESMAIPDAPRVPAPITVGLADDVAYLVLEYIPMRGLSGEGWSRLGEQLAALHRKTAKSFGWHRDNTIGSTPQVNDWAPEWIDFWRRHRLGFQLALAAHNGLDASVVERGRELLSGLDALFAGYQPQPSLMHGDLWSGNVAADEQGRPVLYDPATYYGDREADIAMSELFGRFDQAFYEAYRAAWPLAPGYSRRRTLYNLYHVLNHYNLFGGGYARQAAVMIDELLSQRP